MSFVKASDHNGKPAVHVGNASMSLKIVTGGGSIVFSMQRSGDTAALVLDHFYLPLSLQILRGLHPVPRLCRRPITAGKISAG